ncbi:hypothetical protein GGR56DRAFT_672013 [Xylariaceae sp. FL0804]|nr:hypothetical protein GGR56DRAFT_672013 [Xylariaceae sp. FL0804]
MARTMAFSPLACLVLLLSLFGLTVAADSPRASPRAAGGTNTLLVPACQDYAAVANATTVGLNTTLRAAFMRSSPLGGLAAMAVLDGPASRLPALTADAQLNQQCGNLTAAALKGADVNLTEGTVLGEVIQGAVGPDPHDIATLILCGAFFLMFGGLWISL